MPVPSRQKFEESARMFWERWNFPHCIGAIDGRHIRIKKPPNGGSKFWNFKGFHSIPLQAVVGADYKFLCIDVGGFGSQSDGGTFHASKLYSCLSKNALKLPVTDEMPNSEIILPYVMVGDGAYPLMEHLMTPYRGLDLELEKEIFNKRLSRARMVVECAFGIVCEIFRIFYHTIEQGPKVAELIAKTTCILHNVIIDLNPQEKVLEKDINFYVQTGREDLRCDDREDDGFPVGYGSEVRIEFTKYVHQNPIIRMS